MQFMLVYVVAASPDEARTIGRTLVEERLAAGVNLIDGIGSFYWWQGAVQQGSEAVVIAKTRADLLDRLTARVRDLHSYVCPCIVALPIVGGHQAYLDWIAAETAPAAAGESSGNR